MLDAEQSLINRLSVLRDLGIVVRAMPNKPANYGVISGNGILTLTWIEDQPVVANRDMSGSLSELRMTWVIDLRLTNLREDAGAWAVRSLLYSLLIGFSPDGCGKLSPKAFRFLEREDHYWRMEAEFTCPIVFVADSAEDAIEGLPLLREILFTGFIRDRAGVDYPLPELP